MRKLFILTMGLLMLGFSAKAQFSRVGVKAGLNISNIVNSYIVGESKMGFHVGGTIDYDFNEFFTLQGGLQLSQKGCTSDYNTARYNVKNNFDLNYIEIPILATLRVPVTTNGVLTFNVGPAANIGVFGKTKTDTTFFDIQYENDINTSETANSFDNIGFKRFDISAVVGVGFEWKNVTFNFNYDYGFLVINENLTNTGSNSVLMFSLGYKFKLRED